MNFSGVLIGLCLEIEIFPERFRPPKSRDCFDKLALSSTTASKVKDFGDSYLNVVLPKKVLVRVVTNTYSDNGNKSGSLKLFKNKMLRITWE